MQTFWIAGVYVYILLTCSGFNLILVQLLCGGYFRKFGHCQSHSLQAFSYTYTSSLKPSLSWKISWPSDYRTGSFLIKGLLTDKKSNTTLLKVWNPICRCDYFKNAKIFLWAWILEIWIRLNFPQKPNHKLKRQWQNKPAL